ncbi:hypothetical protein SARC_17089, partial [Sphaeroforma arctica JP610]
ETYRGYVTVKALEGQQPVNVRIGCVVDLLTHEGDVLQEHAPRASFHTSEISETRQCPPKIDVHTSTILLGCGFVWEIDSVG